MSVNTIIHSRLKGYEHPLPDETFFIPDPTTSPKLYVYSKERTDINGNKLKLGYINDATITNKIFMLFWQQKLFECTGSIVACICDECMVKGLRVKVVFKSSVSSPNHSNNTQTLSPSPTSPSPSPSPSPPSPSPPSVSPSSSSSLSLSSSNYDNNRKKQTKQPSSSSSLSLTNTTSSFHDRYWQFMMGLPINKSTTTGPLIDGGVREVLGTGPKPYYVSRNANVFLCTCKSFKFRNGGVDSNGRTTCKHIQLMYTDIPDQSPPSLVIDAPSHQSRLIDNAVMDDVRVPFPNAIISTTPQSISRRSKLVSPSTISTKRKQSDYDNNEMRIAKHRDPF